MPRGENLLAAAAGALVFLALVGALLLLGTPASVHLSRARAGSSFAVANDRGTGRLFRALQDAEVPVLRLEDAGRVRVPTTLLLVEPERVPGSPVVEDLKEVVGQGAATLVVAGAHEQLSRVTRTLWGQDMPETRACRSGRAGAIGELPFSPGRVGVDIETWEGIRAFEGLPPGFRVLMAAQDGHAVVASRRLGRGVVFLVSEPRIFQNAWIDSLENVELACALLSGHETVTFDERWTIPSSATVPAAALLYGTRPGRAAVLGLLGLLLALYLRGLQPGGPAHQPHRRRHPTELVDSLADLHLAAGRGHEMLAHFQQELARSAARRFGLPASEPALIHDLVARRTRTDPAEIRRLLTETPRPALAVRWLGRLDRIRETLGL